MVRVQATPPCKTAITLCAVAGLSFSLLCCSTRNTTNAETPVREVRLYPAALKIDWGQYKSLDGYIDENGKVVINARFDDADPFEDGRARVKVNDKYGFIDANGDTIVPTIYTYAANFSEGRAEVLDPHLNKWGYIDQNGKMVIPPKYAQTGSFSDGLAAVKMESSTHTHITRCQYIDPNGNVVIPAQYASMGQFNSGVAVVLKLRSENKTYGADPDGELVVIDKLGRELFSVQKYAPAIECFYDGRLLVYSGNKYGYLDTSGNLAIPAIYRSARRFSEGLAAVDINEKFGFIDTTGKMRIQPQYTFPGGSQGQFQDGLLFVESPAWRGYIDHDGNHVITAAKEGDYSDFNHGFAEVTLYEKGEPKVPTEVHVINKKGTIVFTISIPPMKNK